SPYTSSCDLAETCVFVKQLTGPFHCGLSCLRHSFSRSYGVILPNSLTKVLSVPLVFSTHLPVSVCGTGKTSSSLRGFSRQPGPVTSCLRTPSRLGLQKRISLLLSSSCQIGRASCRDRV